MFNLITNAALVLTLHTVNTFTEKGNVQQNIETCFVRYSYGKVIPSITNNKKYKKKHQS